MSNNLIYTKQDLGNVSNVITKYRTLVKKIANHLLGKLPAIIQLDDLVQAGMIGLLEAYKKYENDRGASFETYAGIRVRGAMLDEIRKGDWIPRSVHKNSRKVAQAISQVEHKTGRDATNREVAKELDISIEEYNQLVKDATGTKIFCFDDIGVEESTVPNGTFSATHQSPFDKLQRADFKKVLSNLINKLPEREKLVLDLYYKEELNLKAVGEVLGVSESRISQIHSQAVVKLHSRMKDL